MKWLRQIHRRLRVLLRRERFDEDLAEEMQSHLEMQAEEEGPEARRRFGNLTLLREQSREVWGWRLLDEVARDIRFALRQLLRSPGFTAVAVLCLAVGIGVNSTAFSLIDGMWMRPLPVSNPGDLTFPGDRWLRIRRVVLSRV